jgi:amino acid transporter
MTQDPGPSRESTPGSRRIPRTVGEPDGRVTTRRSEPDLDIREVVTGRRGDHYVRITRSPSGLRRRGVGHLEATRETLRPRTGVGRFVGHIKDAVLGEPLESAELAHERLTKVKALAVFSSDALSSSAYATEEILRVVILAGAAALVYTLPIAVAIAILLAIVATSYRQTIRAYPQGGGSYIVTKDNLGTWPSLIAGAGLLVGYVLTVAVSISAGVAAITSALPVLHGSNVPLAVGFVVLMTMLNLRGVKESGSIFAVPTYIFLVMAFIMLGFGLARLVTSGPLPASEIPVGTGIIEPISIILILRAFASGNAALTGVEAISDGVPAFQPPEWKNARTTLTAMAIVLGILFLGISYLAVQFGIVPRDEETVVSQLGRIAFGGDSPLYYLYQAATTMILILAANTAFSDFPRLSYFLARDHFMPHQFQYRGDRLAFSTGILALGAISGLVIVAFGADTHALIPLYATGVFLAFTLSQSSMVVRWWRKREAGWHTGLPVNVIGAATTALVTVIVSATKFAEGAWMVIVLLPIIILTMKAINAHYVSVAEQMAVESDAYSVPELPEPTVLVPVPGINRAVLQTLGVARKLSPNVAAVHVTDSAEEGAELRQRWMQGINDIPLVLLENPFRSLSNPLLIYIDSLQQRDPKVPIVVVLSEFVPRWPWEHLLHNQSALRLKAALFFRRNTVVMDVPFHLD